MSDTMVKMDSKRFARLIYSLYWYNTPKLLNMEEVGDFLQKEFDTSVVRVEFDQIIMSDDSFKEESNRQILFDLAIGYFQLKLAEGKNFDYKNAQPEDFLF